VPNGKQPGVRRNPFVGMEGYNPYIKDSPKNVYVGKAAGKPGDGWIKFDPYVYAMGFKQPWRAAVHPKTGTLYVSDVGPDAGADDPKRGPRGFEEISRVPYGGGTHYGWPRCIGPNWSYMDVDWKKMKTHGKLDCSGSAPIARPIGSNKTTVRGMTGASMYYSGGLCDGSENKTTTYDCDRWPIVGSGGKTSEPVAFYPAATKGPLRLPKRYNDRLFVLEHARSFILSIGSDPAGNLNLNNKDMWLVTPPKYSVNPDASNPQGIVSAERGQFLSPVDGDVGPDGAFYFLEYGAFFYSPGGRVARIKCAGCMPSDQSMNYGLDSQPVHAGFVPLEGTTSFPIVPIVAAIAALGIGIVRRRRLVV